MKSTSFAWYRFLGVAAWLAIGAGMATTAKAEIHGPHCLYGCPNIGAITNDVIIRRLYTVSSNDDTNAADWVSYVVDPAYIGKTNERVWRPDPILADDERLEPDDYKGAYKVLGTDRGHLAPLASFTNHPEWETVNYLSNILPQDSDLNRGPWLKLENAERHAAKTLNAPVYVMTGPIYTFDDNRRLPGADEPSRIPSAFWKVVSAHGESGVYTAAFVMPQSAERKDSHCDYQKPLTALEDLLGTEFFHAADAKPVYDSVKLVGCK